MSNSKVLPDGSITDDSAAAPAAPYLAVPWKLKALDADAKDEQLKRFTMVFQTLAALATILIAIYGFTQRNKA